MPSRFDPPSALLADAAAAPVLEIESSICGVLALPGHRRRRFAQRLHESDPALTHDIASFWQDSLPEWIEIFILAETSGVTLSKDVDGALNAIERVAAIHRTIPDLPSEEEEVRTGAQARLDDLAGSSERRESWASILRRLWAFMRIDWEDGAGAEAERLALHFRGRIDAGEPLTGLIPPRHFAMGDAFRDLMNGENAVVISPLTLNTESKYILQMDGGPVYIGFGTNWEATKDEGAQATEAEANAFKVLSDRTRLGILRTLLAHSASITDLARQFEVSQPTVSAHVKILRDAGLLTSTRRGPLTLYRADKAALRNHLDSATAGLREHGL
jgi:ArsR family transcriptional regulator